MTITIQQWLARSLLGSLLVSGLALTGCSTFKASVSDQSLAYTKTRKLDPIVLPADAQTAPFTPIYQVPAAGENTLKLQNEKGKRYVLPRPVSAVK